MLGLGATLFATVQRGQEVDKSVMNAATYLYVCRHNTDDDARYMAKKFGVNINKTPRKPLAFLLCSPSKDLLNKEFVKFKSAKPIFFESQSRRLINEQSLTTH